MSIKIEEMKNQKELLEELYISGGLSTCQIAGQFSMKGSNVFYWLNKFGIRIRSKSEARKGRTPMLGKHHTEETKRKMSEARKGKNNSNWRGGRVAKGDYVVTYAPEHPNANKRGYVYEHRLIMEQIVGRFLTEEETVHHDKGKANNEPENLRLFGSQAEHVRHECALRREKSR